MKNILLLGDSVRMNYQDYVAEALKGEANVFFDSTNNRFCQFTLRYVHDWIRILSNDFSFDFDIIHWNCGLWDILRLSNETEPITEISLYGRSMECR